MIDKVKRLYELIEHKLDDKEKSEFKKILGEKPQKSFDPIAGTGGSPDYPRAYAPNGATNNIGFEEGTSSYVGDNYVNVYRGLNHGFTNSFEQQT